MRRELVEWLKIVATSTSTTYERRFEAIKILISMGEL